MDEALEVDPLVELGLDAELVLLRHLTWVNPACGNPACADLPTEPACSQFVLCDCGWPTAPSLHCATCQHTEGCHDGVERDLRDA
jgi:hypothetical protein